MKPRLVIGWLVILILASPQFAFFTRIAHCEDGILAPSGQPAELSEEQLEIMRSNPLPAEFGPEGMRKQFKEFQLAFEEAIGSLHSIHVKYRWWDADKPESEKTAPVREWAIQGKQYLNRCETPHDVGGTYKSASWLSFDGEYGYKIQYWEDDPTYPNFVLKDRDVPESARSDPFLGLIFLVSYPPGRPSPLQMIKALQDPVVSLLKGGDRLGVGFLLPLSSNARSGSTSPEIPQNTMYLQFYPGHEGWPEGIRIQPTRKFTGPVGGDHDRHQNGDIHQTIDYLEFQQIDDPILGMSRRFPKRIRSSHPFGTALVSIDEVVVNKSLPKSMFIPELPIGVDVITGYGTANRKSFITGGDAGHKHLQMRLDKRRDSAAMIVAEQVAATGTVTATPVKSFLSRWLVAVALFAIAVAFWVRYRVTSR